MYSDIIILALAVLPVIVLAVYVYRKDQFNKEPFRLLCKAFFFGVLSVIPAAVIEGIVSPMYGSMGGGDLPVFFQGIFTGFVVAGCTEEICKLMFLRWAVWKSPHFDEYFDGIVYATFVSLGFAGIENVMYVVSQDSFASSLATGSMRAILSVPGHFLFAVVMGYYFALARFNPEERKSNMFKAFLYPMLLHGTYDSLLMVPEYFESDLISGAFFIVFIYFDIKLWKIGMRRLKALQALNEEQYKSSAANDTNYSDYSDYGNQGGDSGGAGYGDSGSWNNDDSSSKSNGDAFGGFKWDV
ncbi:MAG: PrsW family intramembrane metalloprotease [Bacteroidales bacterium]|nr:PrsW family intramembrane metalloprotease [Bacteroidales bacterium]